MRLDRPVCRKVNDDLRRASRWCGQAPHDLTEVDVNKIEPWQVIIIVGLTAILYGYAQDFVDWMGWFALTDVGDKFAELGCWIQRCFLSVILSGVIAIAIYALFSWLASTPANDPRNA